MADLKGDDSLSEFPNLKLPQLLFVWEKNGAKADQLEDAMAIIEKNSMAPFYAACCAKYGWALDAAKLAAMEAANAKALADIDAKMEDAAINAGDTEVVDCMVHKANHYAKTGGWDLAYAAYDAIIAKDKVGTSKKIDATMAKCRLGLFAMDLPRMKGDLAAAKKLNESGGDWDRRNRLKVYESMYLLATRDVKQSTALLHSCIATFTCVEICSYNEFMFYALLTSVLHLPRTDLKKKVINNPQVISVIKEVPHMQQFVNSLYDCEYSAFFQKLLDLHQDIANDRFMGPHATYVLRELRILAYSQFLEAYRSVTMSTMAATFGMSLDLLDKELSHFIAAGRINAKIDKVGDVIETSRPDRKNAQYQETIKKGDHLLNQIQKLVRVIEV